MPRTRPHSLSPTSPMPVKRAAKLMHDDGNYTLQGTTENFEVYFQTALGTAGQQLAQGVLGTCEAEYADLQQIFGISATGLPFKIRIDDGSFGAFHSTCADTEIHCAAFNRDNVDLTRMLVVAEEVEVFEADLANGWDCGATNGEGLSRVLATEMYPRELNGFATAATWLDSDRPDYVSTNLSDDTDSLSNGCAVLFLNYLHYQLHYSWPDIVQNGGATLAETYQRLTGDTDAFGPFSALLAERYPPGQPSGVVGDNVFPLAAVSFKKLQRKASATTVRQAFGRRVLARTA